MHEKVVFCTYDSPTTIGGPFSLLGRLLPELRRNGIDCKVLALTHFGRTGPLIEQLRNDKFEVKAATCHNTIYEQVRWILEQVHETPPSVFVPNFILPGLYAARWLKKAGSATIGVIHSDDEFYRAMQDVFVFGNPDFQLTDVVCVSDTLLNDITTSTRRTSTNPFYIAPGVDVPETQHPKPIDRFRIAYVGRLAEEQKRISLVTKALIAACKSIPGTDAIIYGDGPDRSVVESLVREAKAEQLVTLMGNTKPSDVLVGLQQCHAITLLSDYEGLPIALLEGMANGCVAVCRNMRSGIPQLINHEETGFLVSDNPQDFISVIQKLNSDRILMAAVGERGLTHVKQSYSHTISVSKWVSLLTTRTQKYAPKAFEIPKKIQLPKPHPSLEAASLRKTQPNLLIHHLRRLRFHLGAIRRRIF